ncbi:MAG: glycosyltransferase [Coriobacteriales bacterium]|nr:glycosyltransferase [Coriobacteriales bacterium]
MDTPLASIIIPVYNKETQLSACLTSCVEQSLQNLEIICVDDGSSDSSPQILADFAQKDARIRVISQKNQGAAAARNTGIKNACGTYLAFMDADDSYPSVQALEHLVNAAQKHRVQIAGGSMLIVTAEGTSDNSLHGKELDGFSKDGLMAYADWQYDYGFYRFIFERELILANNISFPALCQFEDPPFLVRAMIAAGSFYALKEPVYLYAYEDTDKSLWNARALLDRITGLRQVLELASKNRLAKLYCHVLHQLDYEAPEAYRKHILDASIMHALLCAGGNLDIKLAQEAEPDLPDDYVIGPIDRMQHDVYNYDCVLNSVSFKVGRAITSPLRKLRDLRGA